MERRAEFTDAALRALADMEKVHRRLVLDGIQVHLIDNDPPEITRNKFPLRRPSAHAERELRLYDWRVFYTVTDDGELELVNLKLLIDGEEFEL